MGSALIVGSIPDQLPLHFAKPDGKVIFPGMPAFFTNYGEDDSAVEDSFRIVTMTINDISVQNVGVLGQLTRPDDHSSNPPLYFKGLFRVYFHIVEKTGLHQKAQWMVFDEMSESSSVHEKILAREMKNFKKLFEAYIGKLLQKRETRVQTFLSSPFAKEALKSAREINRNTLVEALDNTMNIINNVHEHDHEPIDIVALSYLMLSEKSVLQRLFIAQQALLWLVSKRLPTNAIRVPVPGVSQKKISDHSHGGDNQSDRAAKSKNLIALLLQPRLITPRFLKKERGAEPRGELLTLDYKRPSLFMKNVLEYFNQYIVNQDRAKRKIAETLVFLRHRRTDSAKPIIGGFFAGPTGVGKTDLVRVCANYLFDNPRGYTHIPCNILQIEHTTARLIGAPPGYIGYNDEPFFSQWGMEKHHVLKHLRDETGEHFHEIYQELLGLESSLRAERSERRPAILEEIQRLTGWVPGKSLSVILFDEFEKAHPNNYEILMQALDDGTFPLMNGEIADFRNSIWFFTSNLYGKELTEEISGQNIMGFHPEFDETALQENFREHIWNKVLKEVERHFSTNPAFFARIGKENIEVCYPLKEEDYFLILKIYIEALGYHLWEGYQLQELVISDATQKYFVREARDSLNRALGVRAFERVFEKLERSINLLLDQEDESNKLAAGDWIYVGVSKNGKEEKEKIVIQKRSAH